MGEVEAGLDTLLGEAQAVVYGDALDHLQRYFARLAIGRRQNGVEAIGQVLQRALREDADEKSQRRKEAAADAAFGAGRIGDVRQHVIDHERDDGGEDHARAEPIVDARQKVAGVRSEEHTSELQSLMRISYAVFC